jgi:CBS domain-containing protein
MTLAGGTVRDFMHRYLEVLPQDATIKAAAERMQLRRIGSVLVESGNPKRGFSGIVTETDLVRKVLAAGLDPTVTMVDQVMASPVLTITAPRSMLDASQLMETHQVRHLCVADGEDIVGIISVRDLVRSFMDAESGPVCELEKVYRPLSILMATTLGTIQSEESILVAARLMKERRIGSLLVVEAGEIVGIVTESDLVRKGLAGNVEAANTRVGGLMSHPVISIDINRTIRDASELMAEKAVRHLAVIEHHKIVGVLSVRDLVKMVSVRDRPRFLGKT